MEALLTGTDYESLITTGRQARHAKDFRVAKEAFEAASALKPSEASPLVALGGLMREAGQIAEAGDLLKRATEIDPRHQFVWHECGITARDEGSNAIAVAFYMKGLSYAKTFLHRSQLAECLVDIGRIDDAVAIASELVSDYPRERSPWMTLIRSALYALDYHKVASYCKRALENDIKSVFIATTCIDALIRIRSWQECFAILALIEREGLGDIYHENRKKQVAAQAPAEAIMPTASHCREDIQSYNVNLIENIIAGAREAGFEHLRVLAAEQYCRGSVYPSLYLSQAAFAVAPKNLSGKVADVFINALAQSAELHAGNLRVLRMRRNEGLSVPKTIFQFWDREPPADVLDLINDWKRCNPDFHHVLFDDKAAREYVHSLHGEERASLYDFSHHPAMKSDLIRLIYLYENGGVYIDADEACRVPLSEWFACSSVDLLLTTSINPETYLHNWFIAVMPKHPLLKDTLEHAFYRIAVARAEGRNASIWEDTGPGCLTKVFYARFAKLWQSQEYTQELSRTCLLSERAYRQVAQWKTNLSYRTKNGGNWRYAKRERNVGQTINSGLPIGV